MNPTLIRLTLLLVVVAIIPIGCRRNTSAVLPPSNIHDDEVIVLFPTYAHFESKTNEWHFDVHGTVFEPESSSAKRAALIAALRSAANVDSDSQDFDFQDDRLRPFLVDNERGKSVAVEIDGTRFPAGLSVASGHFSKAVTLSTTSTIEHGQTLQITAVLPDNDLRTFAGRVHLIVPRGVSVISDIDDTIKHSQVTDKSELLRNTFVREFQPVDGMPDLYRKLADKQVAFHYVSGSPWQLYQPLDEFFSEAGFPEGTFHLKQFRLKDSSVLDLLSSQQETKRSAIVPLFDDFSERRFILIGDSGEQDPEIYGQIAREYPSQIAGVYIRNVTGEKAEDKRFEAAFKDVPDDRWALFDDALQITGQIMEAAATKP